MHLPLEVCRLCNLGSNISQDKHMNKNLTIYSEYFWVLALICYFNMRPRIKAASPHICRWFVQRCYLSHSICLIIEFTIVKVFVILKRSYYEIILILLLCTSFYNNCIASSTIIKHSYYSSIAETGQIVQVQFSFPSSPCYRTACIALQE